MTDYKNLSLNIEYVEGADIPFISIAPTLDYFELDIDSSHLDIKTPYFTTPIIDAMRPEDIILTASFANQSEDNYIGTGNQVFDHIKQYPISSADSTFWIDICILKFWRNEGK